MSAKGKLHFIGVVEKAGEEESIVRIFQDFCAGLKDVEGFSHLVILYWFHHRDNKKERGTLLVTPKKHALNVEIGVFASRSPSRPNLIGLCVVELLKLEGCKLAVRGLDALEGSPIVDLKPYLPRADSFPNARVPDWTLRGPAT